MSYFSASTCAIEYVEKYKSGDKQKRKMHQSNVILKTANNLRFFSGNLDFDTVCANAHCSAFQTLRGLIFCTCVVHQYGCVISKEHFDISSQLRET
jgi:hypothetical protein